MPAVPQGGSGKQPQNQLPMQPGQVVKLERAAPFELEEMAKLGIKPGDMIPANLADIIAEAHADAGRTDLTPVPLGTTPLALPTTISIDTLPPEKQQELAEAVQRIGQAAQRMAELPTINGAAPGVNEAIAAAAMGEEFTLVDNRPKPAAQPQPQDTAAAGPTLSEAGTTGHGACPHCGWDLSRPPPSLPNDADKREYLASVVLAGDRFRRTISLIGGKLKVGLRSLQFTESELVLTQLGADFRAGRLQGDGEWIKHWTEYRMALMVEFVEVAGQGRLPLVNLDTAGLGMPGETAMPNMLTHMREKTFPNEQIYRKVRTATTEFHSLLETLEARMDDESFWEGIA